MNEFPWIRRYNNNSRKPTARDKEIGQRIRWCRQLKGMTLATLAEAIGISLQQLAKYESGQNKIDANGLESIAKIFQISAENFVQEFFFEAPLRDAGLTLGSLLDEPLAIRLLQAWDRIERPEQRDILLQLIKSFGEVDETPPKDKIQPS